MHGPFVEREQAEPGVLPGVLRQRAALRGALLRGRGVHYIVDAVLAGADVLERVDMAAEVGIDAVPAEDLLQPCPHVLLLAVVLLVVGVHRVVSHDDLPLLVRGAQYAVDPAHLRVGVDELHVGILRLLGAVFPDQRCR